MAQRLYLNEKIIKTIVVNLGTMVKSEVPGEAFCELRKIPLKVIDAIKKGEGNKKDTNVTNASAADDAMEETPQLS
jgi:hypothetical protein